MKSKLMHLIKGVFSRFLVANAVVWALLALCIFSVSWYFFKLHHEDLYVEWTRSGGNNSSDKFSSLTQITKENVADLEVAWVHKSGYSLVSDTVQTNPIFAGNTLITTNLDGNLIGIEPEGGVEKWRLNLPAPVGRRGLTYFEGRVYVPTSGGVYVVNAQDGKIDTTIGTKGKFGDSMSALPPVVLANKIIVANFAGVVEAWDRNNGKNLWRTSLAKDNVLPRLWSGLSYDEENQIAFIVTSNSDGLLGVGIKDGGYSCSLIAIDARTGAILWQFQEIKHEIWDLDVVGPPIVATIHVNGKMIPVVAAVTKSGNTLLVDRLSGKPIFGVNYQDAPRSDIPGEISATRQIKIELPEPFSDNHFDFERDVTKLSAQKEEYVRYKLRHARSGNFLPVSLKHDVVFFGLHGGAEWPGAALDRRSGVMVVPSNHQPWILRVRYSDKDPSKTEGMIKQHVGYISKCGSCHGANLSGSRHSEFDGDDYYPSLIGITKVRSKQYLTSLQTFRDEHRYFPPHQGANDSAERRANLNGVSESDLRDVYELFVKVDKNIASRNDFGMQAFWQLLLDSDRMPGSNPPWGYLTAIDLNSGKTKWRIPFGVAHDAASGKDYAGDINFGGVMISQAGLVFANGTRDGMARVFNVDTGVELWKSKLPAVGSAPPMTYAYKGCQYVVFTATGGRFVGFGKPSDTTVAYKLAGCN